MFCSGSFHSSERGWNSNRQTVCSCMSTRLLHHLQTKLSETLQNASGQKESSVYTTQRHKRGVENNSAFTFNSIQYLLYKTWNTWYFNLFLFIRNTVLKRYKKVTNSENGVTKCNLTNFRSPKQWWLHVRWWLWGRLRLGCTQLWLSDHYRPDPSWLKLLACISTPAKGKISQSPNGTIYHKYTDDLYQWRVGCGAESVSVGWHV